MNEGHFLQKIPDSVLEKSIGFSQRQSSEPPEKSFLKARLPSTDISEIEDKIKRIYNFSSIRASFKKRKRRKGCPRNSGISNTKKRSLGLYSIERKGLQFNDLLPLHYCWVEYMKNLLSLKQFSNSGWTCDVSSSHYEEFTQLLWKADYAGAYIKVSKSTNPSLIGIEGLMIFETRNTLKLLGQDNETRSVPKSTCEFAIKIGNYFVKFIGKHFMVKPSERSVKKVKPGKYYDL